MATLNDFIAEWRSEADYICAHTSGSTGIPKDIKLPKADMRTSARATNQFLGLDKTSRAALPLSLDYIAGKMMAVRAMEGEYPLDILEISNEIRLPENDVTYSLIPVVPSQLPSLIERKDYSARIKNLLIGGAQPSESVCEALNKAGYKAYISYGMTETCSHVALCDASDSSRTYRALPGIQFSTDNEDRLIIEAPEFSFGRLLTNDIVELEDNHSFRWRGRFDNAINSGGIKLLPEELERIYAPLIGDIPFYVVGRENSKWGQCVCIVVEAPADGAAIVESLRSSLDHRICPLCFETVDALPRTSNGKIRRL